MLPDIKNVLKPRPRKFRNIARHISPLLLTQNNNQSALSDSDIYNDLSSSRGTERFLGLFSKLGVQFALKKFGVFDVLKNSGLQQPEIVLDTKDSYRHKLQIIHRIDDKTLLSGELVAQRGIFTHPVLAGSKPEKKQSDLILVEWLLLQQPEKSFSRYRPQLPGQEHPGLGIGQLVYEIMYWTARRDGADGVLIVPNYLHTGLFYGRQFLFTDPALQGLIYYIENYLLRKYKLDQLTWACSEGQLIEKRSGEIFRWQPAPMLMPVSPILKDYFSSPEYSRLVQESRKEYRLFINPDYQKKYDRHWKTK